MKGYQRSKIGDDLVFIGDLSVLFGYQIMVTNNKIMVIYFNLEIVILIFYQK